MTKNVQLFLIGAAFVTNACTHSEGSPEPAAPDEAAAAPPPAETQAPAEQPAPTATASAKPVPFDPMKRVFTSGAPH